jgi:AraC-like DNA-binding protein
LGRFEFGLASKRAYKLRPRSVPFWSDGSQEEPIERQLLGTERPFFNSGFRDKLIPYDEVAQEPGFCGRYYFPNVFKPVRGISPGTFRDAHDGLIFL